MKSLPSVALINDTSIYSKHFGCQLVGQAFREQFNRVGLELKLSLPKVFDYKAYAPALDAVDLVVINGEGSIHHNVNFHLLELAEKHPAVLLNCVYEANDANPYLEQFKYISARESRSAQEVRGQGAECELVPDIIFSSCFLNSYRPQVEPKGIVFTDSYYKQFKRRFFLARPDKDLLFAKKHSPANYIKRLLKAEGVVAGRFHAAVACSVLGVPFSTWESNTWKIRGMMEDMGMSHLHSTSREQAARDLPAEFDGRIKEFADSAKQKIDALFERVHGIAKSGA